MAPKQIVLIPIFFKEKAEQNKVSKLLNKTKNDLTKKGYRVIIDDSENSPGFKFNHWELFGVPLRIEIGPRELKDNKATIVRRTSRDKTVINIKDLDKSIEKEAKKLDEDITKNAEKYFSDNVRDSNDFKDLKKIMNKNRGFVRVPFCSVDFDGEDCADTLKAETNGGNVCGTLFPKAEKVGPKEKCIICGKKAHHKVYVAKSY